MSDAPDSSGDLAKLVMPVGTTIRGALERIDASGLGVAFAVDEGGRLRGIVTDGDVRRGLLQGAGLDDGLAAVLNTQPVTAEVGTPVATLIRLFNERVSVIPLVDRSGVVRDVATYTRLRRLPVAAPAFEGRELEYVADCVSTGWVSSAGAYVTRFEEMFAEFTGSAHAVATSNGTTALHLALAALGIGPGDEVLVPSLTFIATANAVRYTGATPVFVDVCRDTWTMDPERAADAITPRTRGIIPVHLYGHPADMAPLLELASRKSLFVVEDAAEAQGARYRGRIVGGLGDLGCFSFYGNKMITTGEGGMVVTNDAQRAARMRMLRGHGMTPERRYWHAEVGFNYRMTNLQAAIGVAQMERFEHIHAEKVRVAARYDEGLAAVAGVELPPRAPWAESVCWLYSVVLGDEFGLQRDEVVSRLGEEGIESRPFFQPIHLMPPYVASGADLPVTVDLSRRGLSLPSSVKLTDRDIAAVCERIAELRPFGRRYRAAPAGGSGHEGAADLE